MAAGVGRPEHARQPRLDRTLPLAVPAAGLLTLFFKGLLELSKSFLDPFGNAGSLAQNIDTEVLVTEMNRDLPRWSATGARVPCLESLDTER